MRTFRALTLTAALAAGCLGLTAPAQAATTPDCPQATICLWYGENYSGERVVWSRGNALVFQAFRHHVGSFVANVDGCFVRYDADGRIVEGRVAHPGDRRANYLSAFGSRMEGIANLVEC